MPEFVSVAKASELKPGEMKKVIVQGVAVALFNSEGSFYALPDCCTHQEASLSEGEFDGSAVECPKHGAKFDVKTGRVLCLPAVIASKPYVVKRDGDDLLIQEKS